MNSLQSPRGTHDLLPENSARWRLIENTFRDICARYHYGEIRTPIFEATELFDRSAGDSSDLVVTKQMYSFTALDGESYSACVPEGTAGVVRAYIQHHLNERGPVCKLYYLNSHFRYEAPQAGRYRQHHQCGVEMFGADTPESDVEVLTLAHDFFGALGLQTVVKINSLGTPQSRAGYVGRAAQVLAAATRRNCRPIHRSAWKLTRCAFSIPKTRAMQEIVKGCAALAGLSQSQRRGIYGAFRARVAVAGRTPNRLSN